MPSISEIWQMIFDWFLNFIPRVELPEQALNISKDVLNVVAQINHYIPFTYFLTLIGIYFSIFIICAIIRIIIDLL